jgi:hypothetical protein
MARAASDGRAALRVIIHEAVADLMRADNARMASQPASGKPLMGNI